ncbi:filamentous hemagglutinin N-terminal domain-containing protein [Herbaspirillum seropedicae]|uniref:hemagglutinin repeat-containing protein n=1 Tax=Herbaspirillum seropedicae TaxID=964 RepID=UPI00111C95A1|nr:hemagglutinin repeat-containing protein [Herbaspirillum seropedicae]QDD65620.1 filamentous hemagglutinin N-terminal domain-containing protein [Herbaspirillum seropedicae]
MNQLCYRIIFNKTRGLLMAVAETTRACAGKRAVGSRPGVALGGLPMARLSWIGLAVLLATGALVTTMPRAYAQIIADPNAPRAQQPVVVNTANGIPQVNIQTPSAAGVSRNTYSQFDVNRAGAILNNSRSDVQTQLGGWVQRNPNLANGTARVILNEVNSSNPSMLRGFVEVAGDRAQVIIANPSGVTCDGCGFINASRSTLTTGTPIINNGSLDGYLVRGGVVSIEGNGLNDSQSSFTDLIARAAKINAGIWSKELKVTVGTNQVNADNTTVTSVSADPAKPQFGIDVAQLGGMYANKIVLVGTEAGVGVRNAGAIGASAGELTLTAAGRIENSGSLTATTSLGVHATGQGSDIVNTGRITSSASSADPQGGTPANTITLDAANIDNRSGATVRSNDITLTALSRLNNAGEISANRQLNITADSILNSATILGKDLVVNARALENTGANALLGAGNSMSLWLTEMLANRGKAIIYSSADMAIAANGVRDANGLVNNTAQIVNEDSVVEAGGNLDIAAANIINRRSNVSVNGVTTVDERHTLTIPSWWHAGPNPPYYDPNSANYNAYEFHYVNPADVLENGTVITPDGYVIGRAVIRTHANDTILMRDAGAGWGIFGSIRRLTATEGTRVLYYLDRSNGISNPDQVPGGDDLRNTGNDMRWSSLPTYSNQYGSCTTDCIKFKVQYTYTDPNSTLLKPYQHVLAPELEAYERVRYAHHVAVEDQLAPGAGVPAEIRAGGNARINLGQSLQNQFSNIVVTGALTLGGAGADITNTGQTLYRRHTFDGTYVTTGGLTVGFSNPSISEVIGTTQGAIVGKQGVTITARNFSNADIAAGSAANIRSDVILTTGSGQSVGSVLNEASIRSNPMFVPATSGNYLLETRTQFTDRRTWLSSDYLLTALNVDPSTTQKRLGDGFYEQRMVREQMAQLTGRPSGSFNDDSQYQKLLSNAVSVAQSWNLRPGVALTPDQVSHLTSDIVWLETQKVVLPDGRTEEVLVPKLYLAHIDKDALKNSGALVSGDNITIQAENISNKGGFIDGRASGTGRTVLVASNDIANLGGGISGDEVVISAGRNVRNETLTTTENYNNGQTRGSYTSLSNQGSIAAGKNLTITAGADITNLGATLASGRSGDAATGKLSMSAGRDINLGTVKTGSTYDANFSGYFGHAQSVSSVGSTVNAGGDLTMVAQRDLSMTAAQVAIGTNGSGNGSLMAGRAVTIGAALDRAESTIGRAASRSYSRADDESVAVRGSNIDAAGGISIKAGLMEKADVKVAASNITAGKALDIAATGDINVVSEEAYSSHSESAKSSSKGFFSSKSSSSYGRRSRAEAIGSNLNGGTVTLQAGRDMNIVGSNVVSDSDTSLSAGNNIAISSATNKFEAVNVHSEKSSGFFAKGGAGVLSVGYGSASANGESTSETLIQQGSNIVSVNGNTQVKAGKSLSVVASDLFAAKDLTLIGASIDLSAAQNIGTEHSAQQTSSSGFSIGLTYNPVAAFKSAYQKSANNNPSTSFIGKSTKYADAVTDGAMAATTPVVVQAGSRSGTANQDHLSSDARVSTLTAGNNLTLLATDGSIASQGTAMSAEGNALLIAKNNIDLNVARSYEAQGQSNLSSGWSIDNRGTLPAGVFDATGKGNGTRSSVTGTSLSVGGSASLSTTQGDITLTAANVVTSGDLAINAAKNLTVQSGQDVSANVNHSNNQAIGKVVISDTERFAGYHTEKSQDNNNTVTQVASNLGSLQGNVSLNAGNTYAQSASNVLAANNVDIKAKAIEITTANDTGNSEQSSSSLKIGGFARVSSPLIDLVNNIENAKKSDGRLQMMQGLAAAANGYQAYSAVTGGSGSLIKGEVGIGFSSAGSQDSTHYVQAKGSTIQGGGDVSISSTEGDLHAVGANISAGKTLNLDSARAILLEAGKSSIASSGDNRNAGLEVGVGYSIGAQTGVYAYISAAVGNGRYDYNAVTNSNTHLTGDGINLKSKGDTVLKGADAHAESINAKADGKLVIESLQDQVSMHSEQNSVGGRVQVSIGTAWDVSGNLSRSTGNGTSQSVSQQSGLFAGNGGYHVAADSVSLTGGAIASSNAGNSILTANSIRTENLQNKMEYSVDSMSLSGGYGRAGDKPSGLTNSGSSSPNLTPGMMLHDSGSSSSTTYATLTDGQIEIAGQKVDDATSLGAHTDLSTANLAVAGLPDVRNVMKEQQALGAAANTVIATSAQIASDLENAAKNRGDEKAAKDWGATGDYTRALKVVTAALVGGLAGQGFNQVAMNATGPYIAKAIGEYFAQPGNENKTAQLLAHAVLGGILAAANGGSIEAGGISGVAGELTAQVISRALYPDAYDENGMFHPERLSVSQTNTVIALSTAAGVIAGGITGGTGTDSTIGGNVASNAATNNFLSAKEIQEKQNAIKLCEKDSDCVRNVEKQYDRKSYLNTIGAFKDSVTALAGLKSDREELQKLLANSCALPSSCYTDVVKSLRELDDLIASAPTRQSLLDAIDVSRVAVGIVGPAASELSAWIIATRSAMVEQAVIRAVNTEINAKDVIKGIPGIDRPFRSVNPDYPANPAVVEKMNSLNICSGTDCSEIASVLLKTAGGGKIVRVSGQGGNDLKLMEYGKVDSGFKYHEVFTDGRYIYDPRLSVTPVPLGDWTSMIKQMNPGAIFK